MSEDSAASRFQRRPEARPEELLDAALAVFGERGFKATTLEEVASRAGVSKGTVYLYFASKEALFEAVVEQKVIARLEASEAYTRSHSGNATSLLADLITRQWEGMSTPEISAMTRVVQAELPQFPELQKFYFEHVVQRHRRLLREVTERGVANGEFRPEAVQLVPTLVPSLVIHLNQRRSLFTVLDPNAPTPAAELEMILSLLLEGIRAASPNSPSHSPQASA